MGLTQARYDSIIDVPRLLWDPTEAPHPRHGERLLESITGVEVHWVGTGEVGDHGDTDTELLGFERYHEVTKSWTDLFYNVGLDTEGFTYEGRDITVRSQGDLGSWLTLLIVVGQDDSPTPAEYAAIEAGIRRVWAAVDPTLNPQTLRYHRERSQTSCPGDPIAALVERIRTNPLEETPVMALHPDAQKAAGSGIWTPVNAQGVGTAKDPATREVAAIMAQRAKDQAIAAIPPDPTDAINAMTDNLGAQAGLLDAQTDMLAGVNETLSAALKRIDTLETQTGGAGARSQPLPQPLDVRIVGFGPSAVPSGE